VLLRRKVTDGEQFEVGEVEDPLQDLNLIKIQEKLAQAQGRLQSADALQLVPAQIHSPQALQLADALHILDLIAA
jgi:hypothetical protein